jgi:hypothetical protein
MKWCKLPELTEIGTASPESLVFMAAGKYQKSFANGNFR